MFASIMSAVALSLLTEEQRQAIEHERDLERRSIKREPLIPRWLCPWRWVR